MIRIVASNRHPDMRDQPRARFVEQSQSLARRNWMSIGICPAAVITGGAMLHVILSLRKSRNPACRILREEWTCKKAPNDQDAKLVHGKCLSIVDSKQRFERRRSMEASRGSFVHVRGNWRAREWAL